MSTASPSSPARTSNPATAPPMAHRPAQGAGSRRLHRRPIGFHSADAALALVMLAVGPIELKLPHERPTQKAAA